MKNCGLKKKEKEKTALSEKKLTENEKFLRDFPQQRHNGPVVQKEKDEEEEKSLDL